MNRETYIEKYFKQSLSREELKVFNSLLESDEEFEALFNEHKDMNAAFKHYEANKLKNFLRSIDSKSETKTLTWYKSPVFYYAAVAILVIALCLPFVISPSSNALFDDYFETYPNVEQPIVRGGENSSNYKAFSAYENENFETAAIHFRTILEENHNPNYRFYYAMSLLNFENYDLASKELEKLKTLDFDYKNETSWYLSLIAIKQKDFPEAISYLQSLEKSNSKFKLEEIKSLLKKLNRKL